MKEKESSQQRDYKDYSDANPLVREILEAEESSEVINIKYRERALKETGRYEDEPLSYQVLLERGDLEIIYEEEEDLISAYVPVSQTLPSSNIRPLDLHHAIGLGYSIKETRQQAPCIAHLNESGQIVVIAGDHRRRGLILATNWNHNLRIDLYLRTLSHSEQMEIQITENKQNPMKPEERAQVYYTLFRMFLENNPEISKKEVASRLNETPSVFYKAIQYEEKLHPEIQRLVDEGAVPYSTSLLFTRIENLEKQLRTFIRANTANMDNGKIRKMINNIISQEELGFGLWSKEEFEEMSKKGAEENFKLTFNREAYQAITYLYFVSKSIQTEELNEYVPMTDAVARDMTKLIFSTMQFLHFLSEKYPNNFEYLQYLVAKELKNSSEYLNPKRLLSTMVRGLDQFVLEEKDANLSQLSLNS